MHTLLPSPTLSFSLLLAALALSAEACNPPPIGLDAASPGDLVYVLPVAAFQDSDADGVGDLTGVRWHLHHIASLGVGTVQLMPLERGYDSGRLVPSAAGLDPALGSDADLAALADDLHELGMRLEVQVPLDAVGRDHAWYRAALRGEGRLLLRGSPGTGWYPTGDKRYYYASGGAGRPDLDWDDAGLPGDRAASLRALLDNGVDGVALRPFTADGARSGIDAAGALAAELRAAIPGLTVASAPDEPVVATLRPWTALGEVQDLPRALAAEAAGRDGDLRWTADVLAAWGADAARTRPFLGDGDRSRFATRVPDADLRRTLMTLHVLGPGHPSLYYGEELDLPDATTLAVDASWRAPMPWTDGPTCGFTEGEPWFVPDPACKVGWNAYDEARRGDSMLAHVRWLADLRRSYGSASATVLPTGYDDVLAFRTGRLLVVGSAGRVSRTLLLPGEAGRDARSGQPVEEALRVDAGGWRVVIEAQDAR